MRAIRLLPALALSVLLIAACTAAEGPGWTYAPAPEETPAAEPTGSPAATSEPTDGPGEPTGTPGEPGSVTLEVVAEGIAFDVLELEAPAGEPFAIHFVNRDASVPHDVDIRTQDGQTIFDGDILNDVGEITYEIDALEAGEYVFICSVHPIPAMTGTLTVR